LASSALHLFEKESTYLWQLWKFQHEFDDQKNQALIYHKQVLETQIRKQEVAIQQIKIGSLESQLANNALLLASQSELLGNFRNDLRQIVREITEPIEALKKIKEKLKTLPCEQIDWMKFEAQFISVHPEFKAKLIEKFPELTPQETRICLLLRVGMKSYEIGRIICVSERGVENHRFNIRKKLGLKTEQTLTEFLQNLK
jgi:DNA-binding CsgD family transcriptional regulator